MIAADGEVLYVGKARILQKRVAAYAQPTRLDTRLHRPHGRAHHDRWSSSITGSEAEALLLENNLIKRSSRASTCCCATTSRSPTSSSAATTECAAARQAPRRARSGKGEYFGPFASAGAVNRTLNALQRAFLLRSCSDGVFASRTRPCLLYQIKRCTAPCVGPHRPGRLRRIVERGARLPARPQPRGAAGAVRSACRRPRDDGVRARRASARPHPRAGHIQAHQGDQPAGGRGGRRLRAAPAEGGQACVQVFFIRAGQNWGNRAYFPRTTRSRRARRGARAPSSASSTTTSRAPQADPGQPRRRPSATCWPKRACADGRPQGRDRASRSAARRRTLVEQAVRNAREALARRMAETRHARRSCWRAWREAFGLDGPPERIEVYDNSHIMGTNAVGAMVVAGPEGFSRIQYRKFNIKSDELTPGDDFGMMREVLTPPLRRALRKEDPSAATSSLARPGADRRRRGPGRRRRAQVLAELGVDDIAGGRRRQGPRPRRRPRAVLHRPGKPPFALEPRDRCSTSSSACATRRTASPSARIARGAPPTSRRSRSTRCRASAPAASARCCIISAAPVRWPSATLEDIKARGGHLRCARPENP